MGSRFDVPSLGDQLFEQLNRLRFEITEARELLKLTKAELRDYMIKINGDCTNEVPSKLEVMHNHIVREKSIYVVINMLRMREPNFYGFLWAPVALEDTIFAAMKPFNGVQFEAWRSDKTAMHDIQPPTYFKTNDVIAPLQLITNTYGVPSY